MSPRRPLAAVTVLLLAMASGVRAESLLSPVPHAARSLPAGVTRGRTLALGRAALGDLRGRASAVVPGFPLGDDGVAELVLSRFTPFSPAARIEVVDEHGVRAVPVPDDAYFTGSVSGDPQSRALIVAGHEDVHGFVVTNGTVYAFGSDGAGRHRSYALRDADPAVWPPPGDFCANDLHPEVVDSPAVNARARLAAGLMPPPIVPVAATTTMLQADVAIETDHELWTKFGSDQGVLNYLASLAAADSAIYERDVAVRLRFSYVRVWASASDPWSATSTSGQLSEVQAYWTNAANNMDAIAGPHDMVHFVSGKSVQGGIAYIGSVCDPRYQFGVSQVYGSFDLSSPSQIWDVLVTTHEMGHNLGTPHTHCYSPALDKCYNRETGCYSGPIVASRGTIMSYCHLLAGGLSNIDMTFGPVVSSTIRTTAAAASCLASVGFCGNGVLDPGEECDDGNTAGGDGCSAVCRREVCGNGVIDPGEQCDDGNTTSGDGCSASCQSEALCGNGIVEPGEQCDDGNTTPGDGCSATCQNEKCKVTRSGQTLWPLSDMTVQLAGTGSARLSLRADFMISMPVASLSPLTTGVDLTLEDGTGATQFEATLPAGPRWRGRGKRWVYRDRTGSVAGIRKLAIRDLTRGDVPEVGIVVAGHGGSYPMAQADLPLALTIVLGDETSGLAGACGRHAFDGASCDTARNGTRFVCR